MKRFFYIFPIVVMAGCASSNKHSIMVMGASNCPNNEYVLVLDKPKTNNPNKRAKVFTCKATLGPDKRQPINSQTYKYPELIGLDSNENNIQVMN